MSLRDSHELQVTREKLASLERRYAAVRADAKGDAHVQELTLQSLKRTINQLKEEITRFEAHAVGG